MKEIEAIRRSVKRQVDADHKNILQEFFEIISRPKDPPCSCGWESRAVYFGRTLKDFIRTRLEIHHQRKRGQRLYGRSYEEIYDPYMMDLFSEATSLRRALERQAPCHECIARFNPTGRRSTRIWNPQRKRAYKEALA